MKLAAKKSLGQNFLVNQGIIDKILVASDLKPDDVVVEIGPGTGNLTKALAPHVAKLIAIEKDRRAIDDLKSLNLPNTEIIEGDALEFNIKDHIEGGYKVIANLPYYITSHFLRTLLEDWPAPELAVLMVQKEVAQRIMSKPPEMNLLALSVQLYAKPELVTHVSRGSFRPMPNVDSAVIKLTPNKNPNAEQIMVLAKKAFAGKRKQLQNTLPEIDFDKSKINPAARPEELSIEDWQHILEAVR